ncbi:hypothetical protein ABT275_01230 [Streptomyces sp. NPDC001185]|uniref:hypothetical protein n=1 Tax=Streptomyces sp. NPDC001185 TaxID=3154380 RepID=UPI00332A8D86
MPRAPLATTGLAAIRRHGGEVTRQRGCGTNRGRSAERIERAERAEPTREAREAREAKEAPARAR